MSQPRSVVEAPDTLLELFRQSQAQLEAEQAAILTDPNADRRRARLRQLLGNIETELVTLEAAAGRFVADTFPAIYRQGGVDIGVGGFRFDQFNRQALELLQDDTMSKVLAATGNMAEDSKRWVRETARALAVRGEIEGQTAAQMARQFARLAPKAVNALGLPIPITAVTYADGSVRTLATYSEMLMRSQCLPPDQVVLGARVRKATRRWHQGDWVTLKTSDGVDISGTPNHPVLTTRGWLGLGEIEQGDQLVCDSLGVQSFGAPADGDVDGPPTKMVEIFDALLDSGHVVRAPTVEMDFHGDGAAAGDVDVVVADGFLRFGDFSPVNKCSNDFGLPESLVGDALLAAFRYRATHGGLVCVCVDTLPPPDSGLIEDANDCSCGAVEHFAQIGERGAGLVRRDDFRAIKVPAGPRVPDSREPGICSFGASPEASSVPSVLDDCRLIYPEHLRDGGRPETRSVRLNDVVGKVLSKWEGHVYNLETVDGYFSLPGAYTGNTAIVYNHGAINTATTFGVTRFEIRDGSGCGLSSHDDGTVADGMIVDAATALAYPISHPNCRRSISGRPDLDGTPVPPVPERAGPPIQIPVPTRAAAQRQARAARQARQARTPRSG